MFLLFLKVDALFVTERREGKVIDQLYWTCLFAGDIPGIKVTLDLNHATRDITNLCVFEICRFWSHTPNHLTIHRSRYCSNTSAVRTLLAAKNNSEYL